MGLDGEKITSNAALTAGLSLTVVAVTSIWLSKRKTSKPNAPPLVRDGVLACLSALGSPKMVIPKILEWGRSLDFPPAMRIPLVPGTQCVMICDPKLQKEIYTDNATSKPFQLYKVLISVRGVNMHSELDNFKHKNLRKGAIPAFSSDNVKRMEQVCDEGVQRWIDKIEDGAVFEPFEEMTNVTLSIMYKTLFDFVPSSEEIKNIVEDMYSLAAESNRRLGNPFRAWLHFILPGARKATKAKKRVMMLGQKLIDMYRSSPNPTRGIALDCIINNPHYEDDAARCRDIDMFLFASYDTTVTSLSWVLYMIAEHPEAAEKVRVALINLPESERPSSIELQKFIRESMRLYPVSALGVVRVVGRDFETSDGHVISKGAIAFMSQILTNLNPKVFGEDAEVFRPDRWDNADDDTNAAFTPFALGSRSCIGRGLAMVELYSAIAKLLPLYKLELVKEYSAEFNLAYHPSGGLLKAKRI